MKQKTMPKSTYHSPMQNQYFKTPKGPLPPVNDSHRDICDVNQVPLASRKKPPYDTPLKRTFNPVTGSKVKGA